MSDGILGMKSSTFNGVVLVLLLVILGIVGFNYYAIVTTTNGLTLASGASLSILADRNKKAVHPAQERYIASPEAMNAEQMVSF